MQAVYKRLLSKSVAAAVSSIDVYNKPDFLYREECFVILAVNSWELLLKAKILKDTGKLSSLYAHQGRRIKKSRCGNPFTIDLLEAARRINLDPAVAENLIALTEIRDTAVHFYCNDPLRYVVYSLGVAALQNYQRLVKKWFRRSLSEYNFHIMPLAFAHHFKTLKMLELEKSPAHVANLIRSVSEAQGRTEGSEFYFACEIGAELKSAKKFAAHADLTVKIDQSAADAAVVIVKQQSKLDQYPLSYRELIDRVQKTLAQAKPHQIDKVMAQHGVKGNEALAAYSFRTRMQEEQYRATGKLPSSAASIYNENAVRFIVQRLEEQVPVRSSMK